MHLRAEKIIEYESLNESARVISLIKSFFFERKNDYKK